MQRLNAFARPVVIYRRVGALGLCILAYLVAAAYNLGLPGLHYDEAKEAGINALELLQGEPLTAFRGATFAVGSWTLPLMVQDYIGALNIYLVMPFLAASGVGVPNLRWPAVFIGVFTLVLLERAVSEWWTWQTPAAAVDGLVSPVATAPAPPITWAGILSVALLALSPSFVFWSRQGIFVTNLTQPLCLLAVWQGLRWLRWGAPGAFILTGASAGLALYAKLLAGWLLGPFALLALAGYAHIRRTRRTVAAARPDNRGPVLSLRLALAGVAVLLATLSPLLVFNLQTGGTVAQLGDHLGQSYYGVDNRAWAENLGVRLGQMIQTLRGDHLWYLGGLYGNGLAPWLAGLGAAAVVARPRRVGMPLLMVGGAVALSLFTISDLFITHFALLQPALAAVAGIGWASWAGLYATRATRVGAAMVMVLWLALDLAATARYHGALTQSGGLADHSDATYHVAYYLRYNGMGAPLALDWGIDAPVRFLSENTVRPIEIFGYASPAAPDGEFARRLSVFLDNRDNVYLLRSPGHAVFAGRREAFFDQIAARNGQPRLLETFTQRDGAPLFELWRVE